MKTIIFYEPDGKLNSTVELNVDNLQSCQGQLIRCILIDNSERVGYADVFRCSKEDEYDSKIHDYIYLWTWKNIDEETNTLLGTDQNKYDVNLEKVNIKDISKIESILYSGPRWGGKLTNKFPSFIN